MKREEYLMKVWNEMVTYLEDVEPDMSQVEKIRFAQGYLYSAQMVGKLYHRDYIKLMNEITTIITKGEI